MGLVNHDKDHPGLGRLNSMIEGRDRETDHPGMDPHEVMDREGKRDPETRDLENMDLRGRGMVLQIMDHPEGDLPGNTVQEKRGQGNMDHPETNRPGMDLQRSRVRELHPMGNMGHQDEDDPGSLDKEEDHLEMDHPDMDHPGRNPGVGKTDHLDVNVRDTNLKNRQKKKSGPIEQIITRGRLSDKVRVAKLKYFFVF